MAFTPCGQRTTRKLPRKDYVALNSGVGSNVASLLPDSEGSDTIEVACSDDSDGPLPHESVSQVSSSISTGVTSVTSPSQSSGPLSSGLNSEPGAKRRKVHTSWTQEHFWVTLLDTRWVNRSRLEQQDRLLVCKRCSWPSTDSSRHGTTSNLATHLRTQHHVGPDFKATQRPIRGPLDRMLSSRPGSVGLEDAVVQWIVQTRQPFTAVEHPSFKAIFEAAMVERPLRCADTVRERIKLQFGQCRAGLKLDLAQHCDSIALSLDTWTPEHQLSIMAVIGHWITPSFEKRETLLDFVELIGPHSGENMAFAVFDLLQELDIAPKLLTITGDNAGNNGTMCDMLYLELSKLYDDEDSEFRLRPLMRFHGRQSFIRCLAHIVNLICKDILSHFGAGSVKEAKAALDRISLAKSQLPQPLESNTCQDRNAIVKIRLLVLWIARSPQRLQEWRALSPGKQISYDIETRWNSTFVMISDALRLRKELTEFVRTHAEIEMLLPTEDDWMQLMQMETVLKPFWEYTNVVSRDMPTIADSLAIYWGLDDLLSDVSAAQGDFDGVHATVRACVQHAMGKADKFLWKMDENLLYYVASVLDPRIKMSLIKAHMKRADASLITSQVKRFLATEYPTRTVPHEEPSQPMGMPDTLWKTLRRLQPGSPQLVSDIDKYLDSPPVGWSHSFAQDGADDWVLKWWKANAFEFPAMARAARYYLPVPSTEVGVERVVSGARDVLGLRRHCMNAETMRWLVLLKSHYDHASSGDRNT